jgi:hypothetical protein
MRRVKSFEVHMSVSEEIIRSLLCQKLRGARGNLFTIKTGQLCIQLMRTHDVSMACKVTVRRYVLSVLQDAVVGELSEKYRIVVLVNKAREILRCGYEN